MLLTGSGEGFGHITAGCLEDDEDVWGLGIGCNGIVEVLLEPLSEDYRPAFDAVARREPIVVLTHLDGGDVVGRSYYREDRGFDGDVPTSVTEREDRIVTLLILPAIIP